jgi:hypothetical protein
VPKRTGSANAVSCVSEPSGARTSNSCVVLVARVAMMSSRLTGCHDASERGRNSVYNATFSASAAGIGGIPSTLRLALGAITSSAAAAARDKGAATSSVRHAPKTSVDRIMVARDAGH